ncbi:hypothetical protein ACHAW5_007151 [Stephanodiscus triporus]|uniref:Uncharacterized protein n=1 Tax=Stephanodiscus triporus TaxID=2934178 RepID=A0ABD3QYL1_9STRA
MEPRTRENEEIAGGGIVPRKKIACCGLLRSKNDVFRRKVHGRVMRLRKMGGDIADIHRKLNLMREHDSGKLPED